MKNDKDINNSLSEIKKVLQNDKSKFASIKENEDFYLLEDIVDNKSLASHTNKKNSEEKIILSKEEKKSTKKTVALKKYKIKKDKSLEAKKVSGKKIPIETVVNEEIKPIIQKWIKKNLRTFVKKVVVQEFKAISKSAFKQKSVSK